MLSSGVDGALALLTASQTTLAGSPTMLTGSTEELAGRPAMPAGGRRQSSRRQRATRQSASIQSMPRKVSSWILLDTRQAVCCNTSRAVSEGTRPTTLTGAGNRLQQAVDSACRHRGHQEGLAG